MAKGILVNGQLYAWGSIRVIPFGVPLTGISEINYNRKQDKDNVYGAGVEPIGQGVGRKTYEGSIKVLTEEWEAIIAASPNGDPLDIPPFTIPVTFGSSAVNAKTHFLQSVQFKEDPFGSKEGDMSIWVTIPLLIGAVKKF